MLSALPIVAMLLGPATDTTPAEDEPSASSPSTDEPTATPEEPKAPADDSAATPDADDATAPDATAPDSATPAPDPADPTPDAAATPDPDAAAADPAEGEGEGEDAATPAPEQPPPAAPPVSNMEAAPAPTLPPSGRDRDLVRRVLIGGGIASLTIGAGLAAPSIYFGVVSVRANERANSPNPPDKDADLAERDLARTRAIALGAVAGAYVITGTVMLALTTRDRKRQRQSVAPVVGGGQFGVVWRGRF